MTPDEMKAKRPVNRERVDAHKDRMRADEVKALIADARHLVGVARGPGNFMEWALRYHAVMVRLADALEAALSAHPAEETEFAPTRRKRHD